MKISHVHLSFTDLKGAIQWMKAILSKEPGYQNDGMAVFSFENIDCVFDKGDSNTEVTLALASNNCESDFQTLTQRGVIVIDPPTSQPWGVKTAYIQGPGKVVFEIEEPAK